MYKRPSKRKELAMRISLYAFMTIAVLLLVSGLIFIILGYRIDFNKHLIEQDSLVQFATTPSGAKVSIDGKSINSNTPTKSTISAGSHTFEMTLAGYTPWKKTQNVQAGTLTWLNYALLVPSKLTTQAQATYATVADSLASPGGRLLLVEQKASDPSFQLVDLTSDTIKTTTISIPQDVYSDATTPNITHTFTIKEWDSGGRYALIYHTYGDKTEWISFDTDTPSDSKNVTTPYDLTVTDAHFLDTGGTKIYVLSNGDLRKVDTAAGTVSRAFASNVTGFDLYGSGTITYVANDPNKINGRIVGLYRDGDENPYVLRETTSATDVPLLVATARYFNDDYIAISEGTKLDILSGSLPSSPTDTKSLKAFTSYTLPTNPGSLTFSPNGESVFTQSGSTFTSYDLEYKNYYKSSIAGSGATNLLKFLTSNYIWSDRDGSLTIRELDGTNSHTISKVYEGQDVTLTQNGKYLYSIGITSTGTYQLQRVKMII